MIIHPQRDTEIFFEGDSSTWTKQQRFLSDIRIFRPYTPTEGGFRDELFYLADWDNEGVVTKPKIDILKQAWDKISFKDVSKAREISNLLDLVKIEAMYPFECFQN